MNQQFFAVGIPKGQPRARAYAMRVGSKHSARMYDPGTADAWRQAVRLAWSVQGKEPISAGIPLCVTLEFRMPRPASHVTSKGALTKSAPIKYHTQKPDADNLAKGSLDALNDVGAWYDDAQVARLLVVKRWADPLESTGCWITISDYCD